MGIRSIAHAAAYQANHEPNKCPHPSTIHDPRTNNILCRKCEKVLEEREP